MSSKKIIFFSYLLEFYSDLDVIAFFKSSFNLLVKIVIIAILFL